MTPFRQHSGVAAPMPLDNVDTDQIIPSREMTRVSRDGLGEALFAGWRYREPGGRTENPDFVLNRSDFRRATLLVAGENFGCGSSREHAVWALKDFGIRAVIAKGFGEIFHGNCIRNGICPVVLEHAVIDDLVHGLLRGETEVSVDLVSKTVTAQAWPGGVSHAFEFDPLARRMLLEGLDPIALTETRSDEIDAFLEKDRARRPWLYVGSSTVSSAS